jgi:hypothetical protein
MKEIIATNGMIIKVDDSDFEYLNQWQWYASKGKNKNTFYAKRSDYSDYKKEGRLRTVCMHREILQLKVSSILVDHRDGDGLNNQRNNLRAATPSRNAVNSVSRKGASSKYLGVSYHKQNRNWRAIVKKDYKNNHIGCFKTQEEAALAYNLKAIELFGEYARLNVLTNAV